MVILYIILFFAAFLIIYTYIIYPSLIIFLSKIKKRNITQTLSTELSIAMILPMHNEEIVINRKLESIFNSDYPLEKIALFIALDDCSDKTLEICKTYIDKFPNFEIIEFKQRMGKPNIINFLLKKIDPVKFPITIISDANVMLERNTLKNLSSAFYTPSIGLVDSKMVVDANINNKNERKYIGFEQNLKIGESQLFSIIQGPFGGCFAFRTELFHLIPENFLVDDFFISSQISLKGFNSIVAQNALVYEYTNTNINEEFNRKRRIAAGNFQNLFYFLPLFFSFKVISIFTFFSHKFLRWITPHLVILQMIVLVIILFKSQNFSLLIFTLSLILFLAYLILFSTSTNKFIYFLKMNFAVLLGFIDYLKGIKTNIWKPTKR